VEEGPAIGAFSNAAVYYDALEEQLMDIGCIHKESGQGQIQKEEIKVI
jgi:hypothetical protein